MSELEKARMEWCAQVYEREAERKETLEKKAQFHLSVVTLVLGAVFLKLDFLGDVGELLQRPATPMLARAVALLAATFVGAGIVLALSGVLAAMRLQTYKNEYPARLVSALFAPGSNYYEMEGVDGFHMAAAKGYALAVESNRRVNDIKASHVKRASAGVLVAMSALTALLGTVASLYLTTGG